MESKVEEWKWIVGYLSGDISSADQQALMNWIALSSDNRRLFDDSVRIWNASRIKNPDFDPETDKEWQELSRKLQQSASDNRWYKEKYFWVAAAAMIVVSFFVVRTVTHHDVSSSGNLITITAGDEVKTFYLPDSSQVWLNSNSSISYDENFIAGRRLLLTGEGFFEVLPDAENAFIVEAGGASIRVIGTGFDVKSYDSTVSVQVRHGEVAVENKTTKQTVNVSAGKKAVLSGAEVSESVIERTDFDQWRKFAGLGTAKAEFERPLLFLEEDHTSKKNQLNQSVLEGRIHSSATIAKYHKIKLKITYKKANGKFAESQLLIDQVLKPGETISYKKKLFDIFARASDVRVEIEEAKTKE